MEKDEMLEEFFALGKSLDKREKRLDEGKMSLEEEKSYREDGRKYTELLDKVYHYVKEKYNLSHFGVTAVLDGEPIENVIKKEKKSLYNDGK